MHTLSAEGPHQKTKGFSEWAGLRTQDINVCAITQLSAAIPGGVTQENPRSFAQRRLQIPPTQNQDCLTKNY